MKKSLIAFLLFCFMILINATSLAVSNLNQPELAPLQQFFIKYNTVSPFRPVLTYVHKSTLLAPYNILLTQPLMTIGIANYYHRTPKIRTPLYIIDDPINKTYARAIVMIVDKKHERDNALVADKLGQSNVVELGLITINTIAIPNAMMNEVRRSHVPFGALLAKNNIKTCTTDRLYFSITCDKTLSSLLECTKGKKLYGRTNTLIREDNGLLIARVVEILTGKISE